MEIGAIHIGTGINLSALVALVFYVASWKARVSASLEYLSKDSDKRGMELDKIYHLLREIKDLVARLEANDRQHDQRFHHLEKRAEK